jgi:hypothetical protein
LFDLDKKKEGKNNKQPKKVGVTIIFK